MAQPYIGEIRMFGGNFAPVGWAFCSGQLLPISEYDTLFTLIGTTYGGDGQSTFALPNLQSRVPIHKGTNGGNTYTLGEMAGTEQETLTTNQIPAHTHTPLASNNGGSDTPTGNYWGTTATGKCYGTPGAAVPMNAASIFPAGGSQPHDNMIPFLCINYIISLYGIFPPQ